MGADPMELANARALIAVEVVLAGRTGDTGDTGDFASYLSCSLWLKNLSCFPVISEQHYSKTIALPQHPKNWSGGRESGGVVSYELELESGISTTVP